MEILNSFADAEERRERWRAMVAYYGWEDANAGDTCQEIVVVVVVAASWLAGSVDPASWLEGCEWVG